MCYIFLVLYQKVATLINSVFLGCWIQSQMEDGVVTCANQEQIFCCAPTRTPTSVARQKRGSLFRCFLFELSLLFVRRTCQQPRVTHPNAPQGRCPQTPSSLQCFINIYLLFFCTFLFCCSLSLCGFVYRSHLILSFHFSLCIFGS